MSSVVFFIAAIGAVGGAIGTVSMQNAFYSVLALVVHLISLAALFLLLRAEFVAASQVIVYAGAVMVLYVFVVAYVGGMEGPLTAPAGRIPRLISVLFAAALFVELCIALIGTGLKALDGDGAPFKLGFGTPGQIGRSLLTTYLVPFEVASLLLLVAAVGAVILARRRAGVPDTGEVSVADVMRSREATLGDAAPETMLEAGGPPNR